MRYTVIVETINARDGSTISTKVEVDSDRPLSHDEIIDAATTIARNMDDYPEKGAFFTDTSQTLTFRIIGAGKAAGQ